MEDVNPNLNLMKTLNAFEVYDESVRTGVVTSGTGDAYEANVKGVDKLISGTWFIMIPHVTSTSIIPTLNVNNIKIKYTSNGKEVEGYPRIRRRLSSSLRSTVSDESENWITENVPMIVMYDASLTPPAWVVVGYEKPDVADLYGKIPASKLDPSINLIQPFYITIDNVSGDSNTTNVGNWTISYTTGDNVISIWGYYSSTTLTINGLSSVVDGEQTIVVGFIDTKASILVNGLLGLDGGAENIVAALIPANGGNTSKFKFLNTDGFYTLSGALAAENEPFTGNITFQVKE